MEFVWTSSSETNHAVVSSRFQGSWLFYNCHKVSLKNVTNCQTWYLMNQYAPLKPLLISLFSLLLFLFLPAYRSILWVLVCVWSDRHQWRVCHSTFSRFSCFFSVFTCLWSPVLSVGSDWINLKMTFLPLLWWWWLNTVCLVQYGLFASLCKCMCLYPLNMHTSILIKKKPPHCVFSELNNSHQNNRDRYALLYADGNLSEVFLFVLYFSNHQ